ncbi:4195_t:CDS:1, partial [Rhizophagus irregularis]
PADQSDEHEKTLFDKVPAYQSDEHEKTLFDKVPLQHLCS